ncbi:helix-turn-helix domain-containing protein [Pseudomonas cremoricolorata]|uniref:MerR family transcriptional regulator n=1 Tax=Pseudomonas cremoricolorata TaxID=157783 RepID=A0A089WQ67_9PSED|nr:helix-turn-helix domain-containing protein [Pseudomonas cremoricolorata]AIR91445.1 MerR family transcriptional regulator [Pseudomonas cremoricolorata]
MDIADVARRSGVPASTLRYYANKGLITALSAHGQRRQFPATVIERLALIALGQAAGFSLDEIAAMLAEQQVDRALLSTKADALDARIRQLQAMSKGLRHAAQCPEENHLACSTFRRLMKVAAVSERKNRRTQTYKPGKGLPAG